MKGSSEVDGNILDLWICDYFELAPFSGKISQANGDIYMGCLYFIVKIITNIPLIDQLA